MSGAVWVQLPHFPMESMSSLGDQPSISCRFVENLQLSVGHDTLWKTLYITYTEEVAWFIG
jgi:hypothetical protein